MDITAAQLRCFLAVADGLHFGRAAQELHISGPSLSQQINTLEKRLRRPLFLRTSRRVELTADGAALVPLARRTVDALDAVVDWASSTRDVVRVGVMAPNRRTDELLSTAVERLPGVSWEVHSIGFADGISAVRSGTVDVALIVSPEVPTSDGITAIHLWTEGRVLLVHERHRLARAPGVSLSEIADETFIGLRDSSSSHSWFSESPPSRILHVAASFDEILQLCAAGVGVNVAGAGAAGAYARPGVAYVPITDASGVTTYLCRRSSSSQPFVRQLEALAREVAACDRRAD